jgi:hypothetical protein
MTDQNITLREFFEEKFRRIEEQNEVAIEKQDAMLAKQDITNGRVRKSEIAIAVLQVGYVVGGVILYALWEKFSK